MAITYGNTARRALRYLLGANLVSDIDTGFQSLANDIDALLMTQSFGKSIIATTESRTNTAYGLMTTPDRVQSLVQPADGLIIVSYSAVIQESVAGAAVAAIFIGANQLTTGVTGTSAPVTIQCNTNFGGGSANVDRPLGTTATGLSVATGASAYTGDVTTGQLVGQGGAMLIEAAAGTYDISVQFKASTGSVTVKNRRLRAYTLGF